MSATTRHRRRVLVVARDPTAGSARVRVLAMLPTWQKAGIDVEVMDWLVTSRIDVARHAVRLLRSARRSDAVVLQKPTQPTWLLRVLGAMGVALLVDVDDAMWVASNGTSTDASRRAGERLLVAARVASVVVTGSQWLAAWIRRGAPDARIEVLGSAVDLAAMEARPRADAAVPVIGWIGSGGNLRDLHPAFVDGLRPLVAEGLATFLVVCDQTPALGDLEVRVEPWSLAQEADLLATMDIGVMPLLEDDRARGRCSYKAVQYLAAGAVPVASPVGGALEVVRDGDTGLVATTAAQWEAALRSLVGDVERRRSLVAAGRAMVAHDHDLGRAAARWLTLLDEVAW